MAEIRVEFPGCFLPSIYAWNRIDSLGKGQRFSQLFSEIRQVYPKRLAFNLFDIVFPASLAQIIGGLRLFVADRVAG